MSWWEALLLAIVEGVTEFLPISSTGHMILLSAWLDRAGEAFVQDYEIIIQGGAILAVVVHSWRRLRQFSLYPLVFVAFLPTALIGYGAKSFLEGLLASPAVVAVNLLLGGVVLLFMDRWFADRRGLIQDLSFRGAVLVGVIQSLSLLPGISRALAALFGAQLVGLSRQEAAEFSFLLAVPTLGAASAYKLWKSPVAIAPDNLPLLLMGIGVAFGVALVSMRFLIALWGRYGLAPFGVYRMLLGAVVLLGLWMS